MDKNLTRTKKRIRIWNCSSLILRILTFIFLYRDDRYYSPEPQYLREAAYPYERSYERAYDYPPERRRYDYNTNRNSKRQGRIIYYANLPEINRSPPTTDPRERFDYRSRNRYDDRYYGPYPYQKGSDYYPYRKDNVRPRYEEHSMDKAPYQPVKNPTEGNNRETKKSPERRLYSENDRTQFSQESDQQ